MAQRTKRQTMPRTRFVALYDPDPDPSPDPGIITILVFVTLALLGASTVTSPGLWTNFLVAINPKVAELEKEKRENLQKTINMIMIIAGLIAVVGFIYLMWRRKQIKKRRRRRRR